MGSRCLDIDTAAYISAVLLDDRTADERHRLEVETTSRIFGAVILDNAVTYMRIAGYYGSGTDTVHMVRRIRLSVLYEHTVHHGTMRLCICQTGEDGIQLVTVTYPVLVAVEEVVGEGYHMVGLTLGTGR